MTVSAQTPINRSTGNGVTTVFPYTFKIISDADIEVTVDDVVKTLNVDYTVSGAGVDAGGNVTMTGAPANATSVVRRRNMALVRSTDYQDQGELPATTLDNDIDATVLMVQQLDERLDRTFSLPASFSGDSTLPAPEPGYLIGWDATGENLTNIPASVGSSLVDIAAPSGSSLIGYLPQGTGAVATTVQAKLRESVSVLDFGASAAASAAVNKAAIQAAIDAVYTAGGGTVHIPAGEYSCSDGIQIKQQVCIVGDGIGATRLMFTGTGDGIYSAYPINSSTAAWNQIKNLEIYSANASNTGGGYVDVGGTYVYLENVYVNGFKYGVIFDQTELADIDLCNFGNNITGGVWLVNGAAHTVGALGVFTNRISVNRCQFNNSSTSYGIIDDGGYSHSFDSNNFNHCYTALRSAGTQGLSITNNYFEGQDNFCIDFQTTTVGGVACGSDTSTIVQGNLFVPVVANTAVNAAYAGYLSFINNDFATASTPVKIAIGTVAQLVEIGNRSGGGAGALTGGSPSYQFKAQDSGNFTPSVAFSGASVGVTYTTQSGKYTRIGNVVTFAINITLSSKGSSVGTLQITGLPYQSAALNQIITAPYINNVLGGITTAAGNIAASGTVLTFFNAAVNASNVFLDTNVSNNTTINVTGSYLAA